MNIRAGEYRWSYTIPHTPLDIRITYSSRSTFTGLFGAGWCSGLDYEDTEVGLFHCGRRIRKPPDDLKTRLRLRAQYSSTNGPIHSLGGHKFVYKDKQLRKIQTASSQYFVFSYNEFQNLISIKDASSKDIIVSYDNDNDRVEQVSSKNCLEKLEYKQSARKRWIQYHKYCSGQLKSAKSYEVTLSRATDGSVFVQKVLFRTLKRQTIIEYSEAGEILNINLTNKKEKS